MITRRKFLQLSGAAASALIARRAAAAEPPTITPSRPRAALAFGMPPGACDTHVHIIGNTTRYPFVAKRAYTPPEALVEELMLVHKPLRLERVVIVQPSFYGTDNSCTLDAIKSIGATARGIAVIDEKTPDAALDDMQRTGIRGVRLNFSTAGITDPAASASMLRAAVGRVRRLNWHIQTNTDPRTIAALKQDFAALPVPLVFDHFGGANAALGMNDPGFDALLELVRAGAYVKISATNLFATEPPQFAGYAAMAQALIAANPDRILWGTNWPHPGARVPGRAVTDISPWRDIDDAAILNLLPGWEPDAAVRKKILVDNPARLFGF
jgi:predicted TIM-barrel fold metal-dependent hydrolase